MDFIWKISMNLKNSMISAYISKENNLFLFVGFVYYHLQYTFDKWFYKRYDMNFFAKFQFSVEFPGFPHPFWESYLWG